MGSERQMETRGVVDAYKHPDKMSEQELRAEVKRLRAMALDFRHLYTYAKNWVCSPEGLEADMEPFSRPGQWLTEVLGLNRIK